MNGKICKQIWAISKSSLWRITYQCGWYSLETKAIVGYVKINSTAKKEIAEDWCKKFDIIQLRNEK